MKKNIYRLRYAYLIIGIIGLSMIYLPIFSSDKLGYFIGTSYISALLLRGNGLMFLAFGFNLVFLLYIAAVTSKARNWHDREFWYKLSYIIVAAYNIFVVFTIKDRGIFASFDDLEFTIWYYVMAVYAVVAHGFNIAVIFMKEDI